MLTKFSQLHERCYAAVERASEVLGRNLLHHYRKENRDAYATNQDVQIGVFMTNHLALQVLEAREIKADLSLGLSLGEWNHLVHIGAVDFETALKAVEYRGKIYDKGPRGAMASVFPIELDELQSIAERAAQGDVLEVVNRNSPRQQVLSGEAHALERALKILDDEHFVSAEIIERNVPMHSSLFEGVGKRFRHHLETIRFNEPKIPYLPNRLARFVHDPTLFSELLSTHLYHPVEWRKSIDLVAKEHPESVFLEVGPMAVLHNLLDSKWHRNITRLTMDHRDDITAHQKDVLMKLKSFVR